MDKKIIAGVIIAVIAIAIIGSLIASGLSDKEKQTENSSNQIYTTTDNDYENMDDLENTLNNEENTASEYSTGKHHAKIEIKDYGTIELELDADTAPITVANFAKLVNEGFYDGLTFHRIMDGFMIQGGDPEGTGMGGSNEEIKGEFSQNGVDNDISHVRGVISMARSSSYDSASSQFFIVHEDSTFLDGQYAGFGKVTSGIEIVDEICEDTQVEDDNGTVLEENQPIIEKITMID